MAVPPHTPQGDPPREIHVEEKSSVNWLAWLLLLLGLAALLWWLLARNDADDAVPVADTTATGQVLPADTNTMVGDTGMAGDTGLAGNTGMAGDTGVTDPNNISDGVDRPLSQLSGYIQGTDPTPATFVFERLNFPTDSTNILPGDQAEVKAMSDALKQRESVRIRVTGYADPRGTKPYNQQLSKDRAEAVKSQLVANGIAAGRIETAGGGETLGQADALPQARAQARRTQVTILSR